MKLLKTGSRGEDVKKMQSLLTDKGYACTSDGIFGAGTNATLKRFQKDNGLIADGVCGAKTWEKLTGSINTKPVSNQYTILRPNAQTTVVKIRKDAISKIEVETAEAKGGLETINSFTKRMKSDFIINGGLYFREGGKAHSLNLLIDDGVQQNAGVYTRYGLRTFRDKTYDFGYYKYTPNLYDTLGGSPSLVVNGKILIDRVRMESALLNNRHPRSAIGMNKDYFFLVTIDGRRPIQGLRGATINELANFMFRDLGCTEAINLDGGGSTRMHQGSKVLNKPLENRAVNNAVCLYLK